MLAGARWQGSSLRPLCRAWDSSSGDRPLYGSPPDYTDTDIVVTTTEDLPSVNISHIMTAKDQTSELCEKTLVRRLSTAIHLYG